MANKKFSTSYSSRGRNFDDYNSEKMKERNRKSYTRKTRNDMKKEMRNLMNNI